TIGDDAPGAAVATAKSTATLTEYGNLPVPASLPTRRSSDLTAFTGAVATFTSTFPANTAADFQASINWGDGTTTVGTITGGNGSSTVSANGANAHTYADEGNFTLTVTVADDAPGTAVATATS